MKWLRLEDYKTIHIVVLLLALSLLPMLLSLPAFLSYLDFSSTGEIGDTIGGITAPFISVFAAILIFNAFKAQIKANELFKNQEISRNILHQIKIIQEDKLDMEKMVQKISILVDRDALRSPLQLDKLNAINAVLYFTSEVRLALELIEDYEGEKDFLYRKLYYLYVIRFKDILSSLEIVLRDGYPFHADYEHYVVEMRSEIKFLNEQLKDDSKYKTPKTEIDITRK